MIVYYSDKALLDLSIHSSYDKFVIEQMLVFFFFLFLTYNNWCRRIIHND